MATGRPRNGSVSNGIAEFLYYAVADGIGRLFTRHGKRNRYTPPEPESNPLGLVFLE